jgi:large subunit ribosomal protein L1
VEQEKRLKFAVVCEDNKAQEAKDAGADIVGSDEFVEKIKGGELNFEKINLYTWYDD